MLSSVKSRATAARATSTERVVSHSQEPITFNRIWREMAPDRRLLAAQAMWADEESGRQQADAVQAIARQLRFRPQSVLRLDPSRLARHLASLRTVSESLAARMLVVYHLASQRPMLEAFLNSLGVAHAGGMITASPQQPPEPARLREAVTLLLAGFPAEDVRVYVQTLVVQDPDVWGALGPIATELLPAAPQG
jgi:hypothetical protein